MYREQSVLRHPRPALHTIRRMWSFGRHYESNSVADSGELKIPVHEGRFTPEELLHADECFLTNTSMEVMPVVSINRQPIGQGIPGPMTRQLHRHFIDNRIHYLEPLD